MLVLNTDLAGYLANKFAGYQLEYQMPQKGQIFGRISGRPNILYNAGNK